MSASDQAPQSRPPASGAPQDDSSGSETPSPTVPLWEVEKELSRQVKVLQGDDNTPVVRARMSNLVVYCTKTSQAQQIDNQISDVIAVHPARVLLLIGDQEQSAADLSATVHVWPVRVAPRKYVYSEQVTIRAGGQSIHRLPFAVRALAIGDLPTNLWWAAPSPPPLAGPFLYELSEHAQQIVYDSLGWPDPTRGVASTASWLAQLERPDATGTWRVASDLNWRRLKYWRRLLMQSLDPASAPGALESTAEILIEHGPHAVVQAWELASWLTGRLGWRVQAGKVNPGVEMAWRFRGPRGDTQVRIRRAEEGPPEIRRVHLSCLINNQPARMEITTLGEQRLSIHVEVRSISCEPRTITMPPHPPAEVVGRQLSDRERDPIFRESMVVAQVMAQSLLQ